MLVCVGRETERATAGSSYNGFLTAARIRGQEMMSCKGDRANGIRNPDLASTFPAPKRIAACAEGVVSGAVQQIMMSSMFKVAAVSVLPVTGPSCS
jgi:hypothetical protein